MDAKMDREASAREVALFGHNRTMAVLDKAMSAVVEAREWVAAVARRPDLAEVLAGVATAIDTITGTIKDDWRAAGPVQE